jgi:hypothetical protein
MLAYTKCNIFSASWWYIPIKFVLLLGPQTTIKKKYLQWRVTQLSNVHSVRYNKLLFHIFRRDPLMKVNLNIVTEQEITNLWHNKHQSKVTYNMTLHGWKTTHYTSTFNILYRCLHLPTNLIELKWIG